VYDELIWGYQTTEAAIVNGSSSSFLANVGSINSRGLELETTIKPTSDLRLTAIGAYNLATYGSFHAAQCPIEAGSGVCDYTGRSAPFAPRFTTDLAAEYQHDLAEGIRGYAVADWNWRSSQNLTLTLSKYGQINAYGIANLRIGARLLDDAIDVSLWANNLFDRKYLVAITGNATTEYYTGTPGAPLTVGSTVRVKF
jgi:iron complex outermembrane receptor protein